MKKFKLNLGCGKKYLDGYVNCDFNKRVKTDCVFDLNKFPYPIKDNIADEILIDNVLEHLDNITLVMAEIHRILIRHGVARIYVPYGKSDGALQDPTHKHFFTENSMNYYTENYKYSYYSDFSFDLSKVKLFFSENRPLLSKLRSLIPLKGILKYYLLNIYDGVYFELKAIK